MPAMSSSNVPPLALPSEYSKRGPEEMEIPTASQSQVPLHQNRTSSCQGPVGIFWDMENCCVPSDVRAEDVAGNIRNALRIHPVTGGAVTTFSAYGDFNTFSRQLREGCQRTGVKLIDVPNRRKDAADKAILVDMFLFALDNSPPSSIVLISGDVDFAPALHILGQRGYTVILVIPSHVWVSSALTNASRFVWDWPSVARGTGFLPPARTLIPPQAETAGHLMGCPINRSTDDQNKEESIVYQGISKSYYTTRNCLVSVASGQSNNSLIVPPNPTDLRSSSPPSSLKEVPSRTLVSYDHNDSAVQPVGIHSLKIQLVNLLELYDGRLPVTRLVDQYSKVYGRPLYVSNYGASKLVKLIKKMPDAFSVEGRGQKKVICLRKTKPSPVILSRRDKKGKQSQEDGVKFTAGVISSEEFSDDNRLVAEKSNLETVDCSITIRQNLDKFKYELQEILVSYSCQILVCYFEAIYQQRYKRQLDYAALGVNRLDELLEKVRDVALVQVEPTSKQKFLVATGG